MLIPQGGKLLTPEYPPEFAGKKTNCQDDRLGSMITN